MILRSEEEILESVKAIQAELSCYSEHPALLLPVTKTHTAQEISVLTKAGITRIGENRVQELMEKYPDLNQNFSFDLIGRLQTNKIKYIINKVGMVQSLDRMELAQEIDRRAQQAHVQMPVLVEVNIGGEAQKGGIAPDETEAFLRRIADFPGLHVQGLMSVMPAAEDPESIRPLFRAMHDLFIRMREQAIAHIEMNELSMGMSHDWQVAAQEGATIVRIGSAIFGARLG